MAEVPDCQYGRIAAVTEKKSMVVCKRDERTNAAIVVTIH